jgi:PAS domain S-box-containing protein
MGWIGRNKISVRIVRWVCENVSFHWSPRNIMPIDTQDVCQALEKGEFVPSFQPLVAVRTGQLAGFEVLARWKHPAWGMISPAVFIPLAEDGGWMAELTQVLLRQAFAAASTIPEPLVLSINISPVQLQDLTLPKQIQRVAEAKHFPLSRTVVEIAEGALVGNLENAKKIARELKAMGCRIALDDFGTGCSSLLHLQSMPFDELKVDCSFVGSLAELRESRRIVAAVVGLGQSLGMTTVGEGVETEEQAEMLLMMGYEQVQGWLFGRPMPAEQLSEMVSLHRDMIPINRPGVWQSLIESTPDALPSQKLAQLQAMYDGAPAGLGFLDKKMRYVRLNRRLAELDGFTVQEHLGRTVGEMMPDTYRQFERYLRLALIGETVSGVEVKRPATITRDEQTLLISYQPARDESGELMGISVSMVDITRMKQANQRMH